MAKWGIPPTNSSGFVPCEFNVIVKPDPVEERTAGGLIKPETTKDREEFSTTKATIVAVAPMAFNDDVWPGDMAKPDAGTRCLIAKHAGAVVDGDDGEKYRIVKDKDVVALIA